MAKYLLGAHAYILTKYEVSNLDPVASRAVHANNANTDDSYCTMDKSWLHGLIWHYTK